MMMKTTTAPPPRIKPLVEIAEFSVKRIKRVRPSSNDPVCFFTVSGKHAYAGTRYHAT